MTTPNIPIVFPNVQYVNGLQVAFATTTTLTVSAGACSDSTNVNAITLAAQVTLDAALNGVVNGLDQGALANNTFYYVFAIGDSTGYNDSGALLSTSRTAPVLPFGYDMFQLIATGILTDGSALILAFKRTGNGAVRKHIYDTLISELSGGTATSFTDVDIASSVPVGNVNVYLQANMIPATADNQLKLRRKGSSSTNGSAQVYGSVATKVSSSNVQVMCDASSIIQYLVSNGSDAGTLLVQGYDDVLY